MVEIKHIDQHNKTVYYTDGTSVNHIDYVKRFRKFLKHRVAGETLVPADMEQFMRRYSSKSLSLLLKTKKEEGFLEGSSDKMLTPGQKIAIGTIIVLSFVGVIVLIMLKSQGLLPGFGG